MRHLLACLVLFGITLAAQSPSDQAPSSSATLQAAQPPGGAESPSGAPAQSDPNSTGTSAAPSQLSVEPANQPSTAEADSRPSFAEWLAGVRSEALARGLRESVVDAALAEVEEPVQAVIERDRAQAEATLSLEAYIRTHVTSTRIRRGRAAYLSNRATLEAVADRYGVPARVVVGIWGMESNFGSFSGVRPTIGALATLAWDPRRQTFFRGELLDALRILDNGDIDLARLRGSWAGAMGQPQFMPSSYLRYAEDFDGDGRRDIWESNGDVFASIANYLRGQGWKRESGWGREVKVDKAAATRIAATVGRQTSGCRARRDMTVALPLSEWRRLGVRSLAGTPLPASNEMASYISGSSRHFLTYSNYDSLLSYNCANAYALSVVVLGERIGRDVAAGRP